ncbi:hypothetical protein APU90_06165 [Rathayibacter toxicus]|uniref:Uncharacterized protein n=1 Tax=Rathayibacter toxicus TaxID=145458 RepID=A0A0C5BF50_9MICO|nr:hypothetical protein TI83_00315 [Rathayibacter toxicus]ALS57406.1 hypothetical protein APU90_06165 [Rathayibacter toxicus]KKM45634.1 hypothetical protein VT73_05540 [Rathayibacter toxicus]
MRIAVVGASGNLGTALLRRLQHEESVDGIVGISRRAPHRLRDVFAGMDAVVHLAWALQPSHSEPFQRWVRVSVVPNQSMLPYPEVGNVEIAVADVLVLFQRVCRGGFGEGKSRGGDRMYVRGGPGGYRSSLEGGASRLARMPDPHRQARVHIVGVAALDLDLLTRRRPRRRSQHGRRGSRRAARKELRSVQRLGKRTFFTPRLGGEWGAGFAWR